MSALQEISYYQNKRNAVPDQILAKRLADEEDIDGIAEIVENLQNKNKSIASDCLKCCMSWVYTPGFNCSICG